MSLIGIADIATLEDIVRAVAEHPGALHGCTLNRFCPYCEKFAWPNKAITHTDDCLVTKARKLLAQQDKRGTDTRHQRDKKP